MRKMLGEASFEDSLRECQLAERMPIELDRLLFDERMRARWPVQRLEELP